MCLLEMSHRSRCMLLLMSPGATGQPIFQIAGSEVQCEYDLCYVIGVKRCSLVLHVKMSFRKVADAERSSKKLYHAVFGAQFRALSLHSPYILAQLMFPRFFTAEWHLALERIKAYPGEWSHQRPAPRPIDNCWPCSCSSHKLQSS